MCTKKLNVFIYLFFHLLLQTISLKEVFEDDNNDRLSFDEVMAVDELVRFILHDFIAHIVENLHLYTIFTNHHRCDTSLSLKRLETQNQNLDCIFKRMNNTLALSEHVFNFDYFEQSMFVFEMQYLLFSDVMDFDPSQIFDALKRVRRFAGPGTVSDLKNRIEKLKLILMNTYSWTKTDVDSIDLMNRHTIEKIVEWFENVIYKFGSLTELISREKSKYDNL